MTGPPVSGRGEPSQTAAWLIGLLRPLTPFAEAIVRRQAERAGIQVTAVTPEHLPTLGPMIVAAAQMFVDPARLGHLRHQIDLH